MLRGNYTAKIDDKGRLKIPNAFRQLIENKYGTRFYVTSLTGEQVRLYPLPEWLAIENRLLVEPSMNPTRRKFLDRTNYFGQETEMDAQGRILIHALLRRTAGVVSEVSVMGYLTYLEVWDAESFRQRLEAHEFTAADEAEMAALGI